MSLYRFHVYSGTGNGRYLAGEMAERLRRKGMATEIVEVGAAEIARLRGSPDRGIAREADDRDVFVFPVYAMAMPHLMNRYMRSLGHARPGSRPKAAVLSVNGRISLKWRDGHEGQALAQATRVLRRLGWDVDYRETFDYPHNVTTIGSALREENCVAARALMEPRLETVATELASGISRLRPCRPWAQLVGWPFGWLYRLVGRRAWGMLFAADEHCDGCGLCAARCPAGAIRLRGGRPDWSYACEGCERCMNLCPKRAIQTSLLRVALIAALGIGINLGALRPFAVEAFGFLPGFVFEPLWEVSSLVLSVVLGLALLRAVDLGLVLLSRIPLLRPVLAFGWTRWTRRYADPSRK